MNKQIVKDCIVKVVKEDGYWLKLGQKYKVNSPFGPVKDSILIHYGDEVIGLNKHFFELSSKYDITDSVAITSSEYHTNNVYVPKGQVGTVVEIFSKDSHTAYEVEFCDENGRTLYQVAVEEKDLLKLYFD